MTHATLLLILDAGRADQVTPETMPFLHGLAQASLSGSFESPPGFAQRTVLFSGLYPDTSGHFGQFVFDPANSPFKWVKGLGPLGAAVKPRKAMFPARRAIAAVTRWRTGATGGPPHAAPDPAWIPPKLLPYFGLCADGGLGANTASQDDVVPARPTNLFDLCRDAGLTVRDLTHEDIGDGDVHELLARDLRAGTPCQLYVARLSAADRVGHSDGPHSQALEETLRTLDRRIAGLHAALAAGCTTWDLFIVGPHGMAPVDRRVDLLSVLATCKAKPAKDYVVLVNSTLALFWYLTDEGRQEIEAVLGRVPGSHLVDEAERQRRRIPTSRQWGDRMLAADPGVLFWPDHFHATDSTVAGMHGYLDKREEGHGVLVLASSEGRTPPHKVGLRPLADAFPTLCQLLGVPVPAGQEGVSLLAPPELALQQLAEA